MRGVTYYVNFTVEGEQVTQKINELQRPPPGRPPIESAHMLSAPGGYIQLMHECWAQVGCHCCYYFYYYLCCCCCCYYYYYYYYYLLLLLLLLLLLVLLYYKELAEYAEAMQARRRRAFKLFITLLIMKILLLNYKEWVEYVEAIRRCCGARIYN